jgi:hypothetical protein
MSDTLDRSELLKRNPQIREERVTGFLEFARRLTEQGFDLAPRYQLAAPLGRVDASQRAIQNANRPPVRG